MRQFADSTCGGRHFTHFTLPITLDIPLQKRQGTSHIQSLEGTWYQRYQRPIPAPSKKRTLDSPLTEC